ncbi:MAG: hypothetical protein EOO02_11800 [Chitinophagaceae bacterium]|nr:MAG: hypothetical protein EOO02_11800 [Chitinophagaceae bacterium]
MAINYLTIITTLMMLLTMYGTSLLVNRPVLSAEKLLNTMEQTNKYVGMWVTADGHIRQELLPGGRYDEARGTRKSAYQGRYEITGEHIKYWDDTGFTATGDFRGNDTLYHGGYIFHREKPAGK